MTVATRSEGGGDGEVVIGLITKTDTNPFFVKMKEGAEAKAEELGAELQSFAGEFDGDNEAQVEAVEQLIAQGAQGILITPSDSAAIVPSLDKAREAGLLVVALDTQTDPAGRRGRHVRDGQLPRGSAHRSVGQGDARGHPGADRDARPQPRPGLGRRSARPRLPRRVRSRRR